MLFLVLGLISACQLADQNRPVQITLGANKLNISADCFDAPTVNGGRKERVALGDALFVFLLSTCNVRTHQTTLIFYARREIMALG
jgi:hypothetical protein